MFPSGVKKPAEAGLNGKSFDLWKGSAKPGVVHFPLTDDETLDVKLAFVI